MPNKDYHVRLNNSFTLRSLSQMLLKESVFLIVRTRQETLKRKVSMLLMIVGK
jgi:hypothetical protein